jgi:hypothetical protein
MEGRKEFSSYWNHLFSKTSETYIHLEFIPVVWLGSSTSPKVYARTCRRWDLAEGR